MEPMTDLLGEFCDLSLILLTVLPKLHSLHDLRVSHSSIATFRDPVDTFSPIYCLQPIGTERFLAGGARHSLIKVFDLRVPGGKLYHAVNANLCSPTDCDYLEQPNQRFSPPGRCNHHQRAKFDRRGWNVFLNLPSNRTRRDSPVYAVSRPSQCSPSFFAGVENGVVQLDIVSIMDKHPDPIFQKGPVPKGDRGDIRRRWDPNREAVAMPMYEHNNGPVNLLKQHAEVEFMEGSLRPGLDERWLSASQR